MHSKMFTVCCVSARDALRRRSVSAGHHVNAEAGRPGGLVKPVSPATGAERSDAA